MNDLTVKRPDLLNAELFNEDFFMANWERFLELDIPNRRGLDDTKDTLRTYLSNIKSFLVWCREHNLHPLQAHRYHIDGYVHSLYNREKPYSVPTVALKLAAIRRFYQSAIRREIIKDNPAKDVKPGSDPNASMETHFLTAGQLEYLIRLVPDDGAEDNLRARTIIAYMGIEGLRTVEVSRMNIEDINWDEGKILIRGKGRNSFIRPSEQCLELLGAYLNSKEYVMKDKHGTPVFTVATSNNNKYGRLTRCGVRDIVDHWLEKAGYKQQGISCHVLRHTCGSILYRETKDLQVVKDVLRHADIKMASKYAHLQDKGLKRYTNAIPVKIK